LGFIDQKAQEEIYRKARFYISIPESDSTSVSLLEAMKYGCIPIVSNIPANREWILNGINGVFFNPNLKLDEISVYSGFYDINLTLLKKRAIFPEKIEKFVRKLLEDEEV